MKNNRLREEKVIRSLCRVFRRFNEIFSRLGQRIWHLSAPISNASPNFHRI